MTMFPGLVKFSSVTCGGSEQMGMIAAGATLWGRMVYDQWPSSRLAPNSDAFNLTSLSSPTIKLQNRRSNSNTINEILAELVLISSSEFLLLPIPMQLFRLAAPVLRHSGCSLAIRNEYYLDRCERPGFADTCMSVYTRIFDFPSMVVVSFPEGLNEWQDHPAVGHVLSIYANMILFHLSWRHLDLADKLKAEKFFVPEDPCRMFLEWRSRSDCRNVRHKSSLFEVKIKHPHAGVFLLVVFVIGFLVVVTCATIALPSWSARRGVAWTLLGHSSGCSVKMLLAAALTNQLG